MILVSRDKNKSQLVYVRLVIFLCYSMRIGIKNKANYSIMFDNNYLD